MRLIPLAIAITACGGIAAESPLTVRLGLTHEQAERALHEHQFCLERSSSVIPRQQQKQRYPRCARAASEHGEAWVVAGYDGDRLVELRRLERYGDEARALERWNELVNARAKQDGPPSEAALQLIKDHGLLEPGTRSVKAFVLDPGTVVGVYLLSPSSPDHASVLEKVSYVK